MTTRSAAAEGWTVSAQRHAVRVGDLERPRRGVLNQPDSSSASLPQRHVLEAANLRSARASALVCPRAVISHASAAIALGLPIIGNIQRPCLTVPAGTALRRLAHAHLHRANLPDDDVMDLDGYRVMGQARTVMDVARERGVAAGVVAADHALHHGLVDAGLLAAAFETCAGWPGRKAARITLLSADGAAESPLESLSRLRIAAQGLPAPRLQTEICDESGRFLGRCDFYWDEFGVVGEADGDLKYEPGRPAVVKERHRQKQFEETGLIVVRWGWSDVYSFEAVARRLRAAYARGYRRGSSERRWGTIAPPPGLHPQAPLARRIRGA
jgi:hypothetical protein